MSTIPSIKGSAFRNYAESVSKLVSEGTITRDELARLLGPGNLQLIERPILVSEWYDVGVHVQLLQVLHDVGPGHLRRVVEDTADRLLESGLYQQLGYLNRMQFEGERDPHERFLALGRDLRLITTLSGAMLNFSHWESKPDALHRDRYVIEVSEAGPFRDIHLSTIETFMNRISNRIATDLWRWERSGPEQVVFRMTRGID